MRLLALLRKEWLLLLRDPHALAVLFIMPTLFLLLMAGAMSSYLQDRPPALHVQLETGGADSYGGFFAAALQAQLPGSRLDAQGAALSARLSLPADFDRGLLEQDAGGPTLDFAAQLDKSARQYLRSAVQIALAQTRLLAFLEDSQALDAGLPLAARLAAVQARTASGLRERELLSSGDLSGQASASQLSVPAWLIFGMFFVALPMAGGFLREQGSGTLLRFRALPLGLPTLLLSKLLPYLLINLLQFALLLAVGVYGLPLLGLPGLTLPGSAVAYLLLALSLSLAAGSLGLLLAGLARSAEQALLLGGGLNIILAALGGIMVPKSVMPAAMRQLAEISPMSWGLDAFLTLLVGQGGLSEIAPYCVRLLLLAVLAGVAGGFLFRKRVQNSQWTTP